MADVQFGDEVEEVSFFDFGVIGEVIEQFADVGRAGDHLLDHLAEGLKDGGIVDGSEIKLDFFYIYLVLTDLLLQFDVILVPGVGLGEVDVCFVGEDEDGAVAGVLLLEVVVDVVEIVHGLHDIRLRTQHVDEGCCVAEDHLLAGGRIVDVVLGWEIIQLEFYLLDFEVVGLHFARLAQQLGGF